ncbi:MAG: 16S rRNA (uracil(1498)-N(3))-methyltransferase [Actinomycetota bacterium]|nr:16S rRNA (uracil(1498)-N(3))-methyltransferase [Actinomycetota bacterium]
MPAAAEAPSGEEPGTEGGPLFFVADLECPRLEPADAHHLTRVLRIRSGDGLIVSDGQGAWRLCRLAGNPSHPTPEPVGPISRVPRSLPVLTVAFALVKGQRPELVVQKLTELGVDTIVPFVADRSVVRWDADRAATNARRLQRVSHEASMQSRRCWLPEITAVQTFASASSLAGAARADRGGAPLSIATPTVLIGPEGGWSDAERAADLAVIGLGVHVLRAETAAIAAGVALAGLRAGLWVPPNRPQRAGSVISDYGS